jgi:II/X family phage/plasmid replication protein
MLDMIRARIPFKLEALSEVWHGDEFYLNLRDYLCDGITIRNQISDDGFGNIAVCYESHAFESLASSYSGVAACIRSKGHRLYRTPYLEVSASPAKILQGHNVFGLDEFLPGWFEMLAVIGNTWPKVFSHLDIAKAELLQIDITYSARMRNYAECQKVMESLRLGVSGHVKTDNSYETSQYFNHGSDKTSRKVYLKYPEVVNQISKLEKTVISESHPRYEYLNILKSVLPYSQTLVRFEAVIKPKLLKDMGIPRGCMDFGQMLLKNPAMLKDMFDRSFKPVFESFRGLTMNRYDDNAVIEKIMSTYGSRKSSAVIGFFHGMKALGGYSNFHDLVRSGKYPRQTFYDNVAALKAIGLSRAYLNSLGSNTANVVPLIKSISIDIGDQLPSDYVRPKLKFAAGMEKYCG